MEKSEVRVKDVSIANFKQLFECCESARKVCVSMYESKYLVESIMRSQMSIQNKLVAIKYVERMRRLPHDAEMTRWK